jgi:hypothetical protein
MNRDEYSAHERAVAARLEGLLQWNETVARSEIARRFVGDWACYSPEQFRSATDEIIRADWRDLQGMLKGDLVIDFRPATSDVIGLPTPRSSGKV